DEIPGKPGVFTKRTSHRCLRYPAEGARRRRCGRRYTHGMPGQTGFSKKRAAVEDGDDRFLALPGHDREPDPAAGEEEHGGAGITLAEHFAVHVVLRGRCSPV